MLHIDFMPPTHDTTTSSQSASHSTLKTAFSPVQTATTTMASVGRVKAVLSGDTLVLTSLNNPSLEQIFSLAFITAPRLSREGDEPYAFESREFLRKLLVGKPVKFLTTYEIPVSKKKYGLVELPDGAKLAKLVVEAGCAKVKDNSGRREEDGEDLLTFIDELRAHEAAARLSGKGLWATDNSHIDAQYEIADPDAFEAKYKGKKIQGVAEKVIGGDRMIVRLLLDPTHHVQTLACLAGIRCPASERNVAGKVIPAEPHGKEARTFVEEKLHQRDIVFEVHGFTGKLPIGTVTNEGRNIAEFLLKYGLAKCNDQHITMLGPAMAPLRAAEKVAQSASKGVHEGFVAKGDAGAVEGIVSRVHTPDTIYIRDKAGKEKKYTFTSLRAPRQAEPSEAPFRDEAKEFLRKKIIGKRVTLSLDGSKPGQGDFEPRDMASAQLNGKSVSLMMVQEGWCAVVFHKRDDQDKAPNYDELLAAMETAKTEKKGMWSGSPKGAKTYVDASATIQKAKIQLPTLQRQKKIPAIVDFVKSGSRFTVLIPRESIKMNFVLGGIRCPKSARNANEKSEPFGDEAHDLAIRRCQQRDVEINVFNVDKVGGFIGELLVNRESFAKILVEEGLASVHHYSAEQSGNLGELAPAEQRAKEARKGMWKDWDPSQDAEEEEEPANGTNGASTPTEKRGDRRELVVTEIDIHRTGKLKVQSVGTGTAALETLMSAFKSFHKNPANSAGLPGPPKNGDYVAAKFTEDGQWYRARIVSNDRTAQQAQVVYIDYGNSEKQPWSKLRPLTQPQFSVQKLKAQAIDASLSFVQLPTRSDYLDDAAAYIGQLTAGKTFVANVDWMDKDGTMYVTLFHDKTNPRYDNSVNSDLVTEGLAMVPRKLKAWERAYDTELQTLKKALEEAKGERRGMWEYGDTTQDPSDD